MDKFENKIEDIFDFDIVEEVRKDNIITEGMLEKAKMVAKKALSVGLDKVLPPEWLSFAQGLLASAKQGAEAVAEFLNNADQEKVRVVVNAAESKAVAEEVDKQEKVIEEQGTEEALAQAAEIGGWLSTGSYIGLAVIFIAAAFVSYKVIKAGIDIYKQTKKMEARRARRR